MNNSVSISILTNLFSRELQRPMGKEEIKEVKNNKEAKKTATQNGVIISVYVESPKPQSPQRAVTVNKAKPKSASKKPQAARKLGYDRRAQLLAYSRDLRNAGSPQEDQRPINNLRSTWHKCLEQKKWEWLMKPATFCIKSHQTLDRTSSRWRYERMPIDRPVGSTSSAGGKKRRPTRRSNSHFLSKIRCMLKELSCKKDDVGKDPKLMIAKST